MSQLKVWTVVTRELGVYIVGKSLGPTSATITLEDPVVMRRQGDHLHFNTLDVLEGAVRVSLDAHVGVGFANTKTVTPAYHKYLRTLEPVEDDPAIEETRENLAHVRAAYQPDPHA